MPGLVRTNGKWKMFSSRIFFLEQMPFIYKRPELEGKLSKAESGGGRVRLRLGPRFASTANATTTGLLCYTQVPSRSNVLGRYCFSLG